MRVDSVGRRSWRLAISTRTASPRSWRLARPLTRTVCGTTLSTSRDSPALGGVYKLVEREHDGVRRPVLKLSPGKQTLAGVKQIWRTPATGAAGGDVIGLAD